MFQFGQELIFRGAGNFSAPETSAQTRGDLGAAGQLRLGRAAPKTNAKNATDRADKFQAIGVVKLSGL
jgi:hypothetical protein